MLPDSSDKLPQLEAAIPLDAKPPRRLTVFERNVWLAWFAQEIRRSAKGEFTSDQIPARVGLRYLAYLRQQAYKKKVPLLWPTRIGYTFTQAANCLLAVIGGRGGAYNYSEAGEVDKAFSDISADKMALWTVNEITTALISMVESGYSEASLMRARFLVRKFKGSKSTSSSQHWSTYVNAAHIVYGIFQARRHSPLSGLNLNNGIRVFKSEDVTTIIAEAIYARTILLGLGHKNSKMPLGKHFVPDGLAHPNTFWLWEYNSAIFEDRVQTLSSRSPRVLSKSQQSALSRYPK